MGRLDGLGRSGVDPIDLVHDDDRGQPQLERLPEHDPGLWHGTFERIDQQQAALRHPQHPLDLSTKVGVTRRVDDVDLDPVVSNRGVLGQDGDALLALEDVRVHDQLADLLVRGKDVGLFEQGIDQGGLAVIDVGNDRHVSQVLATRGGAGH